MQHLHLDKTRKTQITFYKVIIPDIEPDRDARGMTVEDITNAFRSTYLYGDDPNDSGDKASGHRVDVTVSVGDVYHDVLGSGNGALSSRLDALKNHLDLDFAIRNYTEHSIGEG
ncbi:hypothetical protein NMY22_g2178 [Coprinellus aureogranulatus]|nr:hypothetical protein NMY22_g2178 [Coprinellus aureogranulatus]